MYGMVHNAARAMVLERFGEEAWNDILKRSGLTADHFVAAKPYDDQVTMSLIGSACDAMNMASEDLLEAFGEYWITFASRSNYGGIFKMSGEKLDVFIENLDSMHRSIELAMPQANLPSFEVLASTPDEIQVMYRSDRSGLEPFVTGLFQELLRFFGETGQVSWRVDPEGSLFSISRRGAAVPA